MDEHKKQDEEVALFRYRLLADLVHLPPNTKGLYEKMEKKAQEEYCIPGRRGHGWRWRRCGTG